MARNAEASFILINDANAFTGRVQKVARATLPGPLPDELNVFQDVRDSSAQFGQILSSCDRSLVVY